MILFLSYRKGISLDFGDSINTDRKNKGIYLETFSHLTTVTHHTEKEPKVKGSILKST